MPTGSYIPLLISVASLLFSVISLWFTYRQKAHQDRLTSRKALTDAIAAITEANIEIGKLSSEPANAEIVSLRRGINSQRRYLANHAEMLAVEIADLSTDADHAMIAIAFDAAGDLERAKQHWEEAVKKSPSKIIRATNLRGMARFMFSCGNPQIARECYEQALKVLSEDDDRNRRERADTTIMWALAEYDFGFFEEADRRRQQAFAEARRIGSKSSRESMLEFVEKVWQFSESAPDLKNEPAQVALPPPG